MHNGGYKMVSGSIHIPEELLELLKAIFDILTAVAFFFVLPIIVYARSRSPFFARKNIFLPLLGFAILGFISTAMDAIDEFIWFSPKSFYDEFWKPTRLIMLVVALFVLIIAFGEFYRFNKRLLGE